MEDFVTFEIAKKLKEKGFTCELPFAMCNALGEFFLLTTSAPCYVSSSGSKYRMYYSYDDFDEKDCVVPTISQVLKWLREEKEVDIVIYPIECWTVLMGGEKYILSVYINKKRDYKLHHDNIDKYVEWEQAALAGIEYCLDNLI